MGVEFVKCIRYNSGRLSTPSLHCRAGAVFKSSTSTPSLTHGSKSSLLRFPSSSFLLIVLTWPRSPRNHHSITPSKDQHRLPSPPTLDFTPQFTTELGLRQIGRHTILQSSAFGLLEVNGELHISFPRAFLVGPAQGVQGTFTSHSQRHSSSTLPGTMWSLHVECAGLSSKKRQPMAPTRQVATMATTVKTRPDILERSLQ